MDMGSTVCHDCGSKSKPRVAIKQEKPLTQADRVLIAKGLMSYKADMKNTALPGESDDAAYVQVECGDMDALAKKLDLDVDYFQAEPPEEADRDS